VAVVKDGVIVAEGTPAELAGARADTATIAFAPVGGELPAGLSAAPQPNARGMLELRTTRVVDDLAILTGWARERGIDLPGLVVTRPTLEDVYLELTL
jgi:ABC-2 type transport system ATP-binding protein